ncbi:dienelactone hydrolase [Sinobacterium caligoides]|uniref:Dienelactone hydrolase n=1 Tax=Sinobacterium caligoides TaxID=933926 RepID=A0A3N2DNU7_9GAMM|nr:dienelactone hydrolase family protein [Sinobacterium caligoides]ROS01467.1 dienelactone hydrolase [Sinobacterium caligoides]
MQDFNYSVDGQLFKGKLVLPEESYSRGAPAVLVFHDWSGCNSMATDYAAAIAELGFAGIAVDLYGDGKVADTEQDKLALMQPLVDDRARLLSISEAAISAAKALNCIDADNIVAIGFCFGGMTVLDVARSGATLQGVASFHGALNASAAVPATEIKAPILVLHGDRDTQVPFEDVASLRDELNTVNADWQLTVYAQAYHAFMNPEADDEENGFLYSEAVASKAWEALQLFLLDAFVTSCGPECGHDHHIH